MKRAFFGPGLLWGKSLLVMQEQPMKEQAEDQRKAKCRKKCRKGTKSAGVTCVTKQALVEMQLAESVSQALGDPRAMIVWRNTR